MKHSPHRQQIHARRGFSVAFAALAALVLTATAASRAETPPATTPDSASSTRLDAAYGKLPLSFEANAGQSDERVKFLSRGSGYSLFLTENGAVLALTKREKNAAADKASPAESAHRKLAAKGVAPSQKSTSAILRMKLVGAKSSPGVTGAEPLPGKASYFIGNDPAQWRTGVPTYGKVRYEQVY